jgi:hypothetical protein
MNLTAKLHALGAVTAALSCLLLVGCAASGPKLYKKPDLSAVTAGTPIKDVRALRKPVARQAVTKGKLKGAETWLYEWDLPNDEVNNKVFTAVVVKDGVILGWVEESADKWRKDPKLYKDAKMATATENYYFYMAQAARYQAAANYAAGYGAMMAERSAAAPMQAYNTAFGNPYLPAPLTPPIDTSTRLASVYDARGELAGSVNRRGQLLDSRGELAGSIDEDGKILDSRGDLAGSLNDRGQILDSRGEYTGSIR